MANCNQHLELLGIPVPFLEVACGIALANPWLVVLWQLFASQAQSLLLMTTVAMPVFSKKNETVSALPASLSSQPAEGKGCNGPLWGFKALGRRAGHSGSAADLWQDGWPIISLWSPPSTVLSEYLWTRTLLPGLSLLFSN